MSQEACLLFYSAAAILCGIANYPVTLREVAGSMEESGISESIGMDSATARRMTPFFYAE